MKAFFWGAILNNITLHLQIHQNVHFSHIACVFWSFPMQCNILCNLGPWIGTLNIPIALAEPKVLAILFIFMEKKKTFLSKNDTHRQQYI